MMPRLIYLPLLLSTLFIVPCAGAQEIGRLFTTPEARAGLDKMRRAGPKAAAAAQEQAQAQAEAPVEATPVVVPVEGDRIVVIDGVVSRNGTNARTVWIDAVARNQYDRGQHSVAVVPGDAGFGSVVVQLPSGKQVRLKAGQSVDAVSGRVRDVR